MTQPRAGVGTEQERGEREEGGDKGFSLRPSEIPTESGEGRGGQRAGADAVRRGRGASGAPAIYHGGLLRFVRRGAGSR